MAIGDKPNQNLFGTNYNPEDEEEKKARLAAQGAMMGAGVGTPSNKVFVPSLGMAPQSLVDQVTQLPPMQEPTPMEVAPTMTNNAANGGMQLREPKQTNGGVLGFGSTDVESPFAITGTPDFSNLNLNGVNLQIPPELQFDTPGTSEAGLTNLFQEGSLPRMVTEAAGATGDFAMDKTKDLSEFLTGQNFFTRDKTAREVEGSLAFLQSPEVQASMKAAQAPSEASALGATQGSTSTSMDTTNNVVSRQEYIDSIRNGTGAVPAVAMFKNGKPLEGQELRNAIADKMEDNMSYNRSPAGGSVGGLASTAPTNGLTTVGGASLSEFLSGQAMPEQGFTQEESPLSGRGVTLTPDQMNALSAEREARIGADQAISDRDRRAARGDDISMADQTAMAKANDSDATPREVARGNQVANALGVDLKTGQPLQATGGLTETERLNREKFELEQTKFIQSIIDTANTKGPLSPAQKKFAEEAGKGAYSWDQGGRQTSQENIGKFGQIIQDLEQGQLDTRTLSEFVPFGGDWWRSALNPTGQQGLDNVRGVIFQGLRDTLGAQFTEKEGERLVNAAYNPKLNEEQNIARLKPALARMKATFQAKEALTKHIMDGGDIREYRGKTPMDVYKSFDGQAGSGSPIPGDVDVDVQSNAQAILDRQ